MTMMTFDNNRNSKVQYDFMEHKKAYISNEGVNPFYYQRRVGKAVRFAQHEAVAYIESSNEYSDEERGDSWYSSREIKGFRDLARLEASMEVEASRQRSDYVSGFSFVQSIEHPENEFVNDRTALKCQLLQEYSAATSQRGIELRVSRKRQRARKMCHIATLGAQQKLVLANIPIHQRASKLAKVASRFSRWAREVALRTGQLDELMEIMMQHETPLANTVYDEERRIFDEQPSKRTKLSNPFAAYSHVQKNPSIKPILIAPDHNIIVIS